MMDLMPPPGTRYIPTSKWQALRILCRVFWVWRAGRLEMGLERPTVQVPPKPDDLYDGYELADETLVTLRFIGGVQG
jgi:hypothetical protein